MEPLNLPAQLFLFGYSLIHSVQVERHKFLAALHELLRQQAQQAEALLQ
jgi:hypothetical protein